MPHLDRSLVRQLLLLLAIALVLGFGASGARGLYETTEGRYAESAREMIETGEWLEPQLAHHPHLTKPPLTYWAIAAGLRAFGTNEFGARAANGVAFVLSVFAVLGIGALLWDRRTGLVAGLIYATSLATVAGADSLSTDTLLTLFELLTVLAWLAAVRRPDRERRYVFLAWVAMGFGILTKGPAALVPLAPILAYDLADRRPFRMVSLPGVAACIAISLGWYAAIVLRDPSTLDGMVNQQLTGRLFANAYNRNDEWYQPFRVYLPIVALGCGPWMWFGIHAWRRRPARVDGARERPALPRRLQEVRARPALLLAFWIVPPFVVFSLAQSRLPLYVLPLIAPVAVGLARALVQVSDVPVRRAVRIAVPLAALELAGLFVAARLPHPNDMRALHEAILGTAGDVAPVYAFDEEFLHGLRFYRGGQLTRLAHDDAAYADAPLETALDDAAHRTSVFVARGRHTAALEQILGAHHVAFREEKAGRWRLLITRPQPGSAQIAGRQS